VPAKQQAMLLGPIMSTHKFTDPTYHLFVTSLENIDVVYFDITGAPLGTFAMGGGLRGTL
jgi:hypothetical protein